jgi:cation transport ATPase
MAPSLKTQASKKTISELIDNDQEILISTALTLPVLIFAMSEMIPGRRWFKGVMLNAQVLSWIQFLLATPCRALGRFPVVCAVGWASIRFTHLEHVHAYIHWNGSCVFVQHSGASGCIPDLFGPKKAWSHYISLKQPLH